jgi:hypothetical protein
MTTQEMVDDFNAHVDSLLDNNELVAFARTVGVTHPAQLTLEPVACFLGVVASGNPAWTVM